MNYLIDPFKKMFDFSGKSNRKEFWLFYLLLLFIFIVIAFLSKIIDNYIITYGLRILVLIPFYAIGFRRLNDASITKWLFLIPIVNLILAAMPSKQED